MTISDDSHIETSARLMYLAGILVTVAAVTVGLTLHWMSALTGPGLGLFGIDAWFGAFGSLGLIVIGAWMWRAGGRHVGVWTRRIGKVVLIVAAAATLFGAERLLAASWSAVCSPERPDICFHMGELLESKDRPDARQTAYETACDGEHVAACGSLIEQDRRETFEQACAVVDGAASHQIRNGWVEKCARDW